MFVVGTRKDNNIVDVNDKVLEDHVLKDFVYRLYYSSRSIAIALLHDTTAVISQVCEEGGVLFRVSFDSDIVVPIC